MYMNIINILEIYTKTIYNIIFIYIYTMKCFFVDHFLLITTKIVAEKYMQLASEPYLLLPSCKDQNRIRD